MISRLNAVIADNKSWLFLAFGFFMLGFMLTYTALKRDPELFTMLEEIALPLLRELGDRVFSTTPLQGTAILFMHNLTASLQVIIFGFILGIPPLLSTLANGTLLGAMTARLAQEGIMPLQFLVLGILPHGIFEIPAFLFSAALGLKLGYHVVFPLPDHSRGETLGHIFREIKHLLPAIVLLLAAAALIEVFITPALIRNFL